jgi:hypothetical protein
MRDGAAPEGEVRVARQFTPQLLVLLEANAAD